MPPIPGRTNAPGVATPESDAHHVRESDVPSDLDKDRLPLTLQSVRLFPKCPFLQTLTTLLFAVVCSTLQFP